MCQSARNQYAETASQTIDEDIRLQTQALPRVMSIRPTAAHMNDGQGDLMTQARRLSGQITTMKEGIRGAQPQHLGVGRTEADRIHAQGLPFHFFVMTTSNHRPYTYPDDRIDDQLAGAAGAAGGTAPPP